MTTQRRRAGDRGPDPALAHETVDTEHLNVTARGPRKWSAREITRTAGDQKAFGGDDQQVYVAHVDQGWANTTAPKGVGASTNTAHRTANVEDPERTFKGLGPVDRSRGYLRIP